MLYPTGSLEILLTTSAVQFALYVQSLSVAQFGPNLSSRGLVNTGHQKRAKYCGQNQVAEDLGGHASYTEDHEEKLGWRRQTSVYLGDICISFADFCVRC